MTKLASALIAIMQLTGALLAADLIANALFDGWLAFLTTAVLGAAACYAIQIQLLNGAFRTCNCTCNCDRLARASARNRAP